MIQRDSFFEATAAEVFRFEKKGGNGLLAWRWRAECTDGLDRCSRRHHMIIPRHVVFLAAGFGRHRAPARHCKSKTSRVSLLQWRACARWCPNPPARKTTCCGMIMWCLLEQRSRPSVHSARHRQAKSPSPCCVATRRKKNSLANKLRNKKASEIRTLDTGVESLALYQLRQCLRILKVGI